MFEQVKLDYNYYDLEPYIDTLTMETHYGKHHASYTKNFNEAVEKAGLFGKTVEEILSTLNNIPDVDLRTSLQNNGGGYYNHNLYFSIMGPKKDTKASSILEEAIKRDSFQWIRMESYTLLSLQIRIIHLWKKGLIHLYYV